MRLSTISDQVLDDYDLDRADARQEARAGQLWAALDRSAVAVAPTEAGARWMLGREVEKVQCSTMSEANIEKVRLARTFARSGSRRGQTVLGGSRTGRTRPRWAPALGRLEIPLGESAWQESSNGVAPAAELSSVDNHIEALRDVAWSQLYVRPAQSQPITIDALYEAMRRYTVEAREAPTMLFANRYELRAAVRGQEDPMWSVALESGRLLGMRLDLTAPPGVWSVGGTVQADEPHPARA